jgi:hypothetical protein
MTEMKFIINKSSHKVAMLFEYFLDLLLHFDQNHKHQTLCISFISIHTAHSIHLQLVIGSPLFFDIFIIELSRNRKILFNK